jgi:hypothetical protein
LSFNATTAIGKRGRGSGNQESSCASTFCVDNPVTDILDAVRERVILLAHLDVRPNADLSQSRTIIIPGTATSTLPVGTRGTVNELACINDIESHSSEKPAYVNILAGGPWRRYSGRADLLQMPTLYTIRAFLLIVFVSSSYVIPGLWNTVIEASFIR